MTRLLPDNLNLFNLGILALIEISKEASPLGKLFLCRTLQRYRFTGKFNADGIERVVIRPGCFVEYFQLLLTPGAVNEPLA